MNKPKSIGKKWEMEANKRFKRALSYSQIDQQFYYRRQNIQRMLACQYKPLKNIKNENNNYRRHC